VHKGTMISSDILQVQNYVDLLVKLKKAQYLFARFTDELGKLIKEKVPFVLLRHDVDFSIRGAIKIAQIEQNLGVKTTYFFHLRTPLYNTLSAYAFQSIKYINEMGHDICLHYDQSFYGDGFLQNLIEELNLFQRIFPFSNTRVVSFHKVGNNAFNLDNIEMPPGIIHTYQKVFFKDISYHSDSGGRWKRGNPGYSEDFLQKRPMQILTHPMWWTEIGTEPFQQLTSYLDNNREQTVDFLEQTVISYSLSEIRKKGNI
jgi:hypothetical protein